MPVSSSPLSRRVTAAECASAPPRRYIGERLNKQLSRLAIPAASGSSPRFRRAEFTHRMRQQSDADAELLDRGHVPVDASFDAAPVEMQRKRKPANAIADDG
jgi:hypothetical protein